MICEKVKRNRILIVAITRMGDMLQATPTIIGLKQENPDARITVLIEKDFASICKGMPWIDEVFTIDLSFVVRCLCREKEGIVEAYEYFSSVVDELKSRDYDYCLNMSSSAYTALLLRILGIEDSRGWMSDEEGYRLISNPWAMLFAAFVYHSNRDYNSINLVDIFRCSAGVSSHPRRLHYEIPDTAKGFGERFVKEKQLSGSGPLICIQAGASQEKRQWAPARFAQLVELLVTRLNARIIFTGAKSELSIVEQILSCCSQPNIASAVGETNLEELASLLEVADILVTGDTGPMHLAVAVGTPVVALFLASALCHETGPYGEGNIVLQPQITCNPCNPNYPCARPDCHDQISPELLAHLVEMRIGLSADDVANLRVDQSMADPRQVSVMATTFDDDGFLFFKPINGSADRKGLNWKFFESIRSAYRTLWKEELEAVQAKPIPALPAAGQNPFRGNIAGLEEILRLTEQGIGVIEDLKQLIADEKSPPHLLGVRNAEIAEIDKKIEALGLSYPALGALVRMHIMDKQNMRGKDPMALASEVGEHYQRLRYRGNKFSELFDLNAARLIGSVEP